MRRLKAWALILAAGLFGLSTGSASAQTVDFESSAYAADKTIVGADGWLQATEPVFEVPDNFKAQAGAGGKWLHALTSTNTTVYRSFPSIAGILDVRWKWRALGDSVHFCLGVSGASGSARLANRGLACLEHSGTLSAQGSGVFGTASKETWAQGVWHYMRMVLDNSAGTNRFALYISEDSLRGSERLAMPAIAMGGSGPMTRIVLRDEGGSGYVDLDDLSWETTAVWQPLGSGSGPEGDTLWSTARNWSTGVVPDSSTHVLFSEAFPRGCALDRNVAVKSVTVAPGYKGNLNLGAQVLTVLGKADFTGGSYPYTGTGHIRFPSPRGSALIGPDAGTTLATIRHDGPGLLRLEGRALSVANLNQIQGTFDFNGLDLSVIGDLNVKNGQPATLRNLDGRAITVGHTARLEGTSKDTLLGLGSAPKGWSITVSGADTLLARFASLGNARAPAVQGFAFQSADAGGNSGWVFATGPAIVAQPKDTAVKLTDAAVFRVSASSKLPMTYQWMRNDQPIAGQTDSTYIILVTRKTDSGATFSCKVSNSAGATFTSGAKLKVEFPPPTVSPAPQPLSEPLSIKLTASIVGSKTFYSINGAAYTEFIGNFTLKDSTLLRAFSTYIGDTSSPAAWNFPRQSLPQAPEPSIDPGSLTFLDTVRVIVTAPGASIFYTTDGTVPDSAKIPYTGSLLLSATTNFNAIAYRPGYRPSPVASRLYIHKEGETIPPPTANPPGAFFTDSIVVRVSPPAGYPDAAVYYMTGGQGTFRFTDSLVLHASTTLKAIAISGSRYSDTAVWEFKRRLEAPTALPKSRSFTDTLRVSLATKIQGAAIHYTLDGSDPTAASATYPGRAILIDSTAVLKAVAVLGGDISAVLSETYTLIPDTPSASHRGGDYSSGITLSLSSSAAGATLYYTLDGTTPGPERGLPPYSGPFKLDTSATLKAVAVTGTGSKLQRSPLRIENYTFISPGPRVLGPGQRIDLSPNYSLVSPLAGASPVNVEVLAVDSLKSLKGFRDILFGIKVTLPEGASAFPKVVINSPKDEPRSLYSMPSKGVARYLSGNDTAEILAPGTYFLAVDTLPPVITYSGETFTVEDSTRLVVSIQDNVSNLLLDLERSDKADGGFTGREITSTLLLNVSLKNPPGSLLPLTIRLRVDDHSGKSVFPADGSLYALAQRFTSPIRTPAAFHIGSTIADPWDLIAVPLAMEPPLTLAQLRKNNAVPGMEGAMVNPATGKYRYLEPGEPLLPGAAIWIGAPTSVPSLIFPALQTASRHGKDGYALTLHHGWNQVANPTLGRLWWPVTREFPELYDVSQVKGLHAWDAAAGAYVHAETLEPWRGYFAWYDGSRDTTVDLRFGPVEPPAQSKPKYAAVRGAGAEGIAIRLDLAGGPVIRLGAAPRAEDGKGVEDEPQPVGRIERGARLFSARAGLRLETDLLRWIPGNLYAWKVIAGLPVRNARLPGLDAGAVGADSAASAAGTEGSARVHGLALPPGYAAWAVSRKRGLRFPLAEGSAIPMVPGFTDSLEVLAGPAAELEARLAGIPGSIAAFDARIAAAPGSFALHLSLPDASHVRMRVWTLAGGAVEDDALYLPQGAYDLVRNHGGRGYPAGLYVLALEWNGGGHSGHLTRKIAIP
ncbi:MAG: S-layer protein [Fibrobacteres bacterium]|nr:S-layer protein [Fibrobacterota bacterium]